MGCIYIGPPGLIPRKDQAMACTCSGAGREVLDGGIRMPCVVCHPPRTTPQGLAEAQKQAITMAAKKGSTK